MGVYRLSAIADRHLAEIFEFSLLTFGEAQADVYFDGLQAAFTTIAAHPEIGRLVEPRLGTGDLRRLVHRRHLIFYELDAAGVLIIDILGAAQDPERHPGTR